MFDKEKPVLIIERNNSVVKMAANILIEVDCINCVVVTSFYEAIFIFDNVDVSGVICDFDIFDSEFTCFLNEFSVLKNIIPILFLTCEYQGDFQGYLQRFEFVYFFETLPLIFNRCCLHTTVEELNKLVRNSNTYPYGYLH